MKTFKISAVLLTIAFTFVLAGLTRAVTTVNLNTADNFAILAGSTITNTGSSVVNGDLGLSPGTSVTGFPPGILNGVQRVANTAAVQAKTDLTAAYTAASQTPVSTVPTELGGTTKTAGVYNSADGTFGITGTLTLDAQGDSSAVFIFKTASTLITAGSSVVSLTNGAQACNVFWQVGSSATLGANSTFKGNILALTSATLTTGANVEGRVLAQNGAVTLDTNTITRATCAAAPHSNYVLPLAVAVVVPPLINVKKVPTPLALPDGPGLVTYDYTVFNAGIDPLTNVTVTDNKCSAVNFILGDVDDNSILETGETWHYRCSTTLSQTTLNTVTATGQANGLTAIDTANATVVVGTPLPPPLIHLVKKPDKFTLPASGPVTYTYTVTNPGIVALSNVSVADDKCSPVAGRSGDTNNDNMLDISETWTYACQMNLTTNTVNTATAEGSANGLTAIDYALATVVVTPPGLPNTGIDPNAKSAPWNIIIFAGILMFVSISLVVVLRKRAV